MGIEIRVPAEEDWLALCHADGRAFGFTWSEQERDERRPMMDLSRFRIATDGGEIVGTVGSFAFDVTVPGGATLPMGGVTWVSASSTHRRQGIATQLIAAVHADIDERDEPIANLYASDASIYERFGYGIASQTHVVQISTRGGTIAQRHRVPQGEVRYMSDDEARVVIPPLWDRYRRTRPAEVSRPNVWHDAFVDQRSRPADGASAAFHLRHADGYASYRVAGKWTDGRPDSELRLTELVAVTPDAHVALWQTLLDVDLVSTVKTRHLAADDALRYLVDDYRAVRTVAVYDGIWVNVRNPKVCLEARTYATDDRLVIELADAGARSRRYALHASPHGSSCRPVRTKPDLTMTTAALGALLYGGVRPSTLAAGSRLEARSGDVLRRADLLFPSAPLPYCQTPY